jgi:hypothetical protein
VTLAAAACVLYAAFESGACRARPETSFVNVISVPGDRTDLSALPPVAGNTRLGAFASDLEYDPVRNLYFGIPDRGPGGGLIDYVQRVEVFTLDVDKSSGAISNFRLIRTILLEDASGQLFTGLNPGLLNHDRGVIGRSLDLEGLVVGSDGHFYVADEYGPCIYEFGTDGRFVRAFEIPSNLIPRDGGGAIDYANGLPTIVRGRQDNHGFEGLAASPDGTKLIAFLQGPLVNEGAGHDGRLSPNVRLVVFDRRSGRAIGQYIYQLESLDDINERVPDQTFLPAAQGRNIGVSGLLALTENEFLVLERDNRGWGIDDPTGRLPVATKRIYRIDITGATDVSEISLANTSTLPPTVAAVAKTSTPFIDIAATLTKAGLPIPEKFEGLTIGPRLDDGGHLLLVGTDNDFSVTQTGSGEQHDVCIGGSPPRQQVLIDQPCPSGSALLPTFLYSFRLPPGLTATTALPR